MNRFGILSYATVLASIFAFFILSGPNANLHLIVAVLALLSLLGIVFAILSKKFLYIFAGVISNGLVMVVVFFLLLAVGISEK